MELSRGPLVSVITAFFNEERFISETVQSVIDQEYDNWELILVDDGSTDKSTGLAKKYASDFPGKIIYLEHENHKNNGLCASRNLGLQYAKGNYIALLDADDVWLNVKLKMQVEIVLRYQEVAMVAESSLFWHSWNKDAIKSDIMIPVGVLPDRLYNPPVLLTKLYPLSSGAAPAPSSLLIRTSCLKEKGGFENEFTGPCQLYEDQAFLSKIYLDQKVYISGACNNKYRQRQSSLVHSVHRDGEYDNVRQFYLGWLQQYLLKRNIKNRTINNLIRKAFVKYRWPYFYYLTSVFPSKLKDALSKMVKG